MPDLYLSAFHVVDAIERRALLGEKHVGECLDRLREAVKAEDAARTDEARSIESDLVDALEEELENYQNADKSWAAVSRVSAALNARDTEIARLNKILDAIEETCREDKSIDLKLIGELVRNWRKQK